MAKPKPKPGTSLVYLTPRQKLIEKRRLENEARLRRMGFPVPGDVSRPRPERAPGPVKVTVDPQGRVVNPASAVDLLTAKPRGTGKATPDVVAKPPKKAAPKPTTKKRTPAPVTRTPTSPAAVLDGPATTPTAAATTGSAPYQGMSSPQMSAEAAKLVSQILGPQIASTSKAYNDQGASVNAAYQAAAEMNRGVAPATEQAYAGAASREAVIAKGLAMGAQLAGQETAGASNEFLAKQGGPQQVTAANIAAPLGSMGGLSAGTLNQQGAAFTAAAQRLPEQAQNLGIDALKMAGIGKTGAIAELNARRPELVQAALAQLSKSNLDNRALAQNEAVLAREGYIKETGMTPEGSMPFATRKWLTDTFGVDPISKLPTLEYQRAVTAEKQYLARGKKGGFTATQLRNLKGDALVDARDAFGSETSYQDAILTMLAGGYPLVIAQNALNRFWKRPGALQPWEDVGKGRPKRSFQQRGGK